AGQAAQAYENARLLDSYLQKQKQDNEMNIAHGVQKALLPQSLPQSEGYQFFASYDAAQAVGGDYYDAMVLPEGKICFSFGDVAGKGVPGALIMSRMNSCVRSTMKHVYDVETAINAINDHMCDSAVEGRFVTYVLAILDPESGAICISNAGHMPPVIRRADGSLETFDDEDLVGPPIGVVDGYPYEIEGKTLEKGDLMVLVTDGVDEAMDPDGNFYTAERMLEFVRTGPATAEEMATSLLADVRSHANGRPQNDDITIMVLGRNP
ncbi:MAG: PP2C family protein-serine/threonine phosphatase, partial [Planctomycetota bacterium]|nr:PP2C family protein-serine/threonine phosphatase [Planctomycetota bacterium]